MITLYGMSSPNVLKVSLMLSELNVDYNFKFINIAAGDQFQSQFQSMNPNCKVPVIVDQNGPDGKQCVVFESGAILIYLAEKSGSFLPKQGAMRYDVIQWLMLQMANVGPMFGQLTHFLQFAPQSCAYSLSRYRTAAGRLYDTLDRRLATSNFLAGDDYSIADVATFPWIALYHERHGMLPSEHLHLMRWRDQISTRPAVVKAMIDFESRKQIDPSMRANQPQDGVDQFFGWGRYARKERASEDQ